MKIQDFTGGLNTRLRPQYIQQNEGVVYENIDNTVGALAPVKDRLTTGLTSQRFLHYYIAGAEWLSSAIRRDYVEYQKVLYYTDGVNIPKRFDGSETQLGIAAPTTAPTLVVTGADAPPIQVRATDTQAGNLPLEKLQYRLINTGSGYYSKPYDFEFDPELSRGSPVTLTATEQFGQLDLTPRELVTSSTTSTTSVLIEPLDGKDGDLYRMYEGKWYFVHSITTAGPNPVDSTYDISGNQELVEGPIAPVAGNMQYVYTYYNSTLDIESAPSPVSDLVEDVLGEVELTMGVSTDPQVDKKRIYRIGGFVTTFTRVAEITNNSLLYTDTLKDTELEGSLLTSQDNKMPPATLQFISEAYAILFGAEGNKLRFTNIGEPDYWPSLNFLLFDADITGIAPAANGLLVFTRFRTHIVLGTKPSTFSQQILDNTQGCIEAASIQELGGTVIWSSSDGLCISQGGPVTVFSKNKLGKLTLAPVDSAVYDEVYYLLQENGQVLAFDYGYGKVFKNFTFGVDSLAVGQDTLFGHSEGNQYSLLNGSSNLSMSYKSPQFIEGRITEEKTYKKVYIYHKGDIILNILINNIQVMSKTLTGEDATTVQVPQDKQRGNFIQFEITGTGEVHELEYVVGRGHGHG